MMCPRGFRWSVLGLAAVSLLASSSPMAATNHGAAVPPLVQRFLDRQDEHLNSYRALRRLEAHNTRHNKHGWIDVWTTLDPAKGFKYEIVSEGGSAYVRNKVLRKTLEREAEAHAKSETRSAAIAPANYTFTEQGSDGAGLMGIAIEPLRKESMLVRGTMYLTPQDGDLVRIEGQLAKSPSFWTRRVDITRRYDRISGVRVPTATESVAQVLIAGRSTFNMVYEYASINGREIGQPRPRASEVETSRQKE
jgi:hypothetical protein